MGCQRPPVKTPVLCGLFKIAGGGGREVAEQGREIVAVFDDDVDDLAFDLEGAFYHEQPGLEDRFAIGFEYLAEYDEIGGAGLIFDGDEDDAAGGAWLLA